MNYFQCYLKKLKFLISAPKFTTGCFAEQNFWENLDRNVNGQMLTGDR